MGLQILKFLVAIFIFSRLTHQQATPEERCLTTESGFVCIDCSRVGTCNDGTVTYYTSCPNNSTLQTYCDDTIFNPPNYGLCYPSKSSTNCSCQTTTQCVADPNDPAVVLHCESDPPISDPPCSPATLIDLNTCGCAYCSDDCPLVDDPSDDCLSYFVCNGNDLIPQSCIDGCFNQTLCSCTEEGLTTTTTTTTYPDCIFYDDPNDDCSSYFVFNGTSLIPLKCADPLCFDQALCGCVDTSTTTLSPSCPFYDDPNDTCGSYFFFDGIELIPEQCSGTSCFNQAMCACVDNEGSSTKPLTAKVTEPINLTCSPNCPFLKNPNDDDCGKYFLCDGGGVDVQLKCQDTFCFDEAKCQCV